MKIRNISGEARSVPELGWRTIAADEVVDVPADRVKAYTSQTATWAAEHTTKAENATKEKG